jgi:hypothetical protein
MEVRTMAQAKVKGEEFVLEDWVREGIRGIKRGRKGVLPQDFFSHMHAARKEMLLAYRSLIDAAIERTEETPKRRSQIKVE